eukprot:232983-Pelagomonas_calceolata.AAC.6
MAEMDGSCLPSHVLERDSRACVALVMRGRPWPTDGKLLRCPKLWVLLHGPRCQGHWKVLLRGLRAIGYEREPLAY